MAGYATAPVPPAPKKIHPIVWILIGLFVVMVLAIMAVIAGGLFLAKKVSDNPAMAAATVLAATNPDVEIVTSDTSKGTVTLREKSTGKTVTMNLGELQQGRLVFSGDGKEVSMEANSSGIQVKGNDGSIMQLGSGGALPKWLPQYPGATLAGNFNANSGGEVGGMATYSTADGADKVAEFYRESFKSNGLSVTDTDATSAGAGRVLTATADDGRRVTVQFTPATGKTEFVVSYGILK